MSSLLSSSSRPPTSSSNRRRLVNDSVRRLSRNSLARTESQDTLKPRSLSEFSGGRSSVMSGDQELEFDLYDYNLDNVVAYNPGSMFAPQFWTHQPADLFYPDLTPTQEAFQMTELFPKEEEEEEQQQRLHERGSHNSSGGGTYSSPERKEDEDEVMLRSRTSDLTASVTSADLRMSSYYGGICQDNNTDNEEGQEETDNLLGSKMTLVATAGNYSNNPASTKSQILNLTHIDSDDISFADDEPEIQAVRRKLLNTDC